MKRIFVFFLCLVLISGCRVFPTRAPQAAAGTPADAPITPAAATPAASITDTAVPGPTNPPEATTPPEAADTVIPTESTGGSALTQELLANFTYALNHTPDGLIPLQNGRFEIDQAEPPLRVTSEMAGEAAFGDLNADGSEDAVVLLRTNTGGSGTFYDLIPVYNQAGAPVQAGSASIGDRQVIKELRIENGRIVLDYLTQGPQDPFCCPSQHVLRTYRVEINNPILASEQLLVSADEVATPVPVQIFIDQPARSDFAVSPLHISGRIDPMPAQGFVEFALTDYFDNTLLNSGQIPVQSQGDAGGSFTADIEFDSSAASSTILRLEIFYSENALLMGRSVVEVILPQ